MPKQQIFMSVRSAGSTFTVLKSYDTQFAREVYQEMGETARGELFSTLRLAEDYELDAAEEVDFWEELVDRAREDWNRFSFFIVQNKKNGAAKNLFVSPDWPAAERFARELIR